MAIENVSKILNYQNEKFNKIYYLTLHYDKNYRMMKYQIYRKKKNLPPIENVHLLSHPQQVYCEI